MTRWVVAGVKGDQVWHVNKLLPDVMGTDNEEKEGDTGENLEHY